jgi:hypothetical protein
VPTVSETRPTGRPVTMVEEWRMRLGFDDV